MNSITFSQGDFEEIWKDFLYAKYANLIEQYPEYFVLYPKQLYSKPPAEWATCKLSIEPKINSRKKTIVVATELVEV